MKAAIQARTPEGLRAILAATAIIAMTVPAVVVSRPHVAADAHPGARPQRRVVPPAELPPVEPLRLVDLTADEARAFNATVAFSTDPNPAARAFRLIGSDDNRARAIDCLAAGVVYEAGDDAEGERAVAQVVLNRLRHPAFPKTVCGVVFEGEERATGCQFTFTCDRAMTRWTPTADAWRRARAVATMALSGSVYRPVGYATHYHTDWVVPYWQSSLDKVTAVGTHLFFRWTGWWGTPPAFNRRVADTEPMIAQLAVLSDAHKTGAVLAETQAVLDDASAAMGLIDPVAAAGDGTAIVMGDGGTGDSVLATLPRGTLADQYPAVAARACGDRPICRYSAWSDAAKMPASLPLEAEQVATMTFSYQRDRAAGLERSLWNCQQVRHADRRQCMKQQVLLTTAAPSPVAEAVAVPLPEAGPVVPLDGVRRKAETKPAATPTPKPRS